MFSGLVRMRRLTAVVPAGLGRHLSGSNGLFYKQGGCSFRGESAWLFIAIRVCACACLQETKVACTAQLHLLKVRHGHSRWSSPAATPVFLQVLLGGQMLLVLFFVEVFFFPLYFGGEKNCGSKHVGWENLKRAISCSILSNFTPVERVQPRRL